MANIDLNILPNEAINQKNDTTKHVAWARGDSTTRTFKIIDDAGAAVNVSGYTQIKMTVNSLFDPADNSTQQFEIIGDIASGGANGLVTFTPTTTQTNILADTYFYDIQAEDGSNVISTLIKSKVHIIQDISKTVSGVSTPDAGVITLLIGDSIDNGATNSIKVGDEGDLKIYHQANHSYIAESGSGNLRLQANDLLLEDVSSNKFLKGSAGGTVQIWHNAAGHPAAKLTTSAAGVEINGTVTADSYILDDGTYKTTIVENASSDITLTLPSSTGTLATLADVQASDQLSEVLANGNTTSGTAIDISNGDRLNFYSSTGKTFEIKGINGDAYIAAEPGGDVYLSTSGAGEIINQFAGVTKFKQTPTATLIYTDLGIAGDITVTGTVDGQDVADIGSKATTAHGWGNHASAGYLTSFTETNDLSAAVTWANVPDANITQSSVTQHQSALIITESQISNLGSYLTSFTEVNDLSASVTWANVPDANITQGSVTQHQAALSITKSQVSDFGTYATAAQGILADSALQSIPSIITSSQTISNYVTDTAIDATEFAGYVGKKIIYTGAASTISLPNATAADIGKTWSILNAGTGVITIDVDASGTAQQVRHLHAGGVNTSTTDRTIAIGGVVEIICIAEDNGGITNSSAKPNYAIYGGGVI